MTLHVNGQMVEVRADQRARALLDFLREDLDLTGTKCGCRLGVCGTCTVLVDDAAEQSCRLRVTDVIGKRVLTIEGLAPASELHPLQQAFIDYGALQCGYCTPGMILAAHALLLRKANPTRAEIRKAISLHLCRCTGYQQIIDAIQAAAPSYSLRP